MIENVLLIIDPGHGGQESGAVAFGYKEKDINLEISIELKLAASEYFKNIAITRATDTYFDLNSRAVSVAAAAEKFITEHKDGKVICLSEHNNAFNSQARGCETIHSIHSDPNLANCIATRITELGIPFRRVFCSESTTQKGVDYYCMHRRTGRAQTIIIESLFLDNAQDVQFLQRPGFIPALARKHLEGLLDYLSIPYKTQAPLKEHWAKKDHDEYREYLKANGIEIEDHTERLDQPANEGMVFALLNKNRKVE